MPSKDGTDPSFVTTPIPLDGDGEELIGMVVDGRYRLEATLGRGGMGLVFRATHVGLRRQVAVKILHPSLAASPDVRNRFEREALAVGKVDHPNCVATYDVGRLPEGALYLAMELLDGRSLADVLEREGQLAPGRALHILAHILRGLGHIHQAGMIHRDIKPENIFLIRQGEDLDFAKILDFGIAKPMAGELSDDGVRLTQAGMAFGTPIYMAPEQALGNPLDGRADLYAASVMAYEMLCGQPPFYSDDKLEVMSMHTAKPVPPMRSRLIKGGRPVPSSLEKLILRGLTKKPSDRYANAEVYLAAVESALDTPDGGQTDVNFERAPSDDGADSLLGDDGEVRLATTGEFMGDNADTIGEAISEVLAHVPPARQTGATKSARPTTPRPVSTPGRGVVRDEPSDRVPARVGVAPPVVASGEPRGRPGGVGIGIPYTGPSGEPIFGLTPAQRLAQAQRRRWPLYAGIIAIAVAAGVAIAIFTAPSPQPDEPKLDPKTPAGAASEALAHGDPARAIKILDDDKAAVASDPTAQLVLGHAHAAQNDGAGALAAYKLALQLDPSLESNRELRANLRVMAVDKDPDVVMNAFDVWVGFTKDPEAKSGLLNAVVSQAPARRHAARPVVDRYSLAKEADLVTSYTFDLEQEPTCEKRAEAVGHLRALNNAKAIPALERAMYKRGPHNKVINACLIGDAKAAIGYLSGLERTEEMTALALPDVPRWVEAHGIAGDPDGWRRELDGGFALGHDAARLAVIAGEADVGAIAELARSCAEHSLLLAIEREDAVAALRALGREPQRAILHALAEPDALPELDGAVALPAEAALAHVPAALAGELAWARARGPVWTAWVDGEPVSFAYAPWRSGKWFDVSVDTLAGARQLGLATIVATAMIRDERTHGREPVWGADEHNAPSLRLARRLGFTPVDELWVAPP